MNDHQLHLEPVVQKPEMPSGDTGWIGVWGLLLALFVVLLVACIIWLAVIGTDAFDSNWFHTLLVATFLTGIVVGYRHAARVLRGGVTIDKRSFRLLDASLSQWRRYRGNWPK